MKYIKYRQESNDTDSNIFWVTMSDLLLGLVVVFLVLFVFSIIGFTQNKVNEQETRYEATEKIAQELLKNNIALDGNPIKTKNAQLIADAMEIGLEIARKRN